MLPLPLPLLLRERGIHDPRVLRAIAAVPRARFALADQPLVVAKMVQALTLRSTDRVLEIGTGSGYSAAVLAQLCTSVYSIEHVPEVARRAGERLDELGYHVEVRCADGSRGWPELAPFDAILVGAAARRVPQPLLDQLAVGGRLVMPVGHGERQRLVRVAKLDDLRTTVVDLGPADFEPLIGDSAGSHSPSVRC